MEDLSHYNPAGSVLRKAQLRMLEMLDVFDSICKKHKISYWLACGTLLGAKRHEGFIPWDDDLDVVILQRDSKKLLSVLKKELPENLRVQHRKTDKNYYQFYMRIRDTKSRIYKFRGPDDYELRGIFVDILFVEPVPSMKLKRVFDKLLLSAFKLRRAKTILLKIRYILLVCLIPVVNLLIMFLRFYYRLFSSSKAYAYSYGYEPPIHYNMEYFFPVGEIEFEGKKYNAPSDIDRYLADNFGPDFMTIPKAGDRIVHAKKIEFF